jgi:hypothetical protein
MCRHEPNIVWCGKCAFAATSVIRKESGTTVHVVDLARDANLTHCRTRRTVLTDKRMTSNCKLRSVKEELVEIINLIHIPLLNVKFLPLLRSQIAGNMVH